MKINPEKFLRWALVSLAWISGSVSLIGQATSDVNPHHDGVIFAPAIAVAEGKTPNLEVFSQYGFLVPYIQGTWLKITDLTLINLRFLTLIEVLVTAIILHLILRNRVGYLVAALVPSAWIASYPHLLPFLPWPSVSSTLFIVSAIASLSRMKAGHPHRGKLTYIAFIFLCLATLIRPQTAIITIIVGVFFLGDAARALRSFLKRTLLLLAIPMVFLALAISNNFLDDYIYQSILWASSHYGGLGFTIRGVLELIPLLSIGCVGILGLRLSINPARREIAAQVWLVLAVFSLIVLRFFSWTYKEFPYFSIKHPKVLLADIGIVSIGALSSVAFLLLIAGVYKLGKSALRKPSRRIDSPELIVIICGLTILQLYPATDPLHFWWISPVFILGAVFSFQDVSIPKSSDQIISLALVLYITLCTVNFAHYQGDKRVPYQSRILKGMSGTLLEVQYIDRSIALLNSLPRKSRVKFDCADGIYAVASGKYMPRDENFVNWASNYSKRRSESDFIFQCNVENRTPPVAGYLVLESVRMNPGISGIQTNIVNRLLIKDNSGGMK